MTKVKPYYLNKKEKKSNEKMNKKMERKVEQTGSNTTSGGNSGHNGGEVSTRKQPYITFEDIKRYLLDYSVPNQSKV